MTEKDVNKLLEQIFENGVKRTENVDKSEKTLPVIALRGKVLFPNTFLNFDVGREISLTAIDVAVKSGSELFICAQKNSAVETPKISDIFKVGVVAKIKQVIRIQGGNTTKVSVEALYRASVNDITEEKHKNGKKYFSATVIERVYTPVIDPIETEAYLRVAKNAFYEYARLNKNVSKEMSDAVGKLKDPNEFVDNALSIVPFKETAVQEILEIDDTVQRVAEFKKLFERELEISRIEKKISEKVRGNIDKSQKEFYLREQLRAIHSELGEDPEEGDQLREQILAKNLPKEIQEKALKEIARLDKINPSSPDYSIILNYIDWIKDLPFGEFTVDTEDLKNAKEILDKDHFGLEKVKQRIVEYLAVLQLTKEIKGPILCFVGPPGVGKTSVATSIARALNRKFVRMSLGGVKDEAEIRGHRKTYVGAMPGRIIFGLKNAGSMNPVFLLDEIDKLSSDIHGDPASALLEVLDPEQNTTFRDRYLEVPFDLSKVMFITTANTVDSIPHPLLDRMEIIELTGYTNEEKLQIAKRYLLPKQLKQNGVKASKIDITDDGLMEIICGYTMEAGVRNLDREIANVVRKVATKVAENPRLRKQQITAKKISEYLGVRKHQRDATLEKDEIGACTGLAWTSVGGTTLTIEVGLMKGKGEILLTGKLGDVMKESARAAISYIRANARKFDIDETVFEHNDIHVHVPEGATPKDGPSAGITMATAILSALIKKPVKKSVAMTGEITLRGKVLPIGGLKEKALAAYRQSIKEIIIPADNEKDLAEIPKEILKEINFIKATDVDTVFEHAIKF